MTNIGQQHRFSMKVEFRGGELLAAYSSLITGLALGRAQGLAKSQAKANLRKK